MLWPTRTPKRGIYDRSWKNNDNPWQQNALKCMEEDTGFDDELPD
jgi:hypothetical protein